MIIMIQVVLGFILGSVLGSFAEATSYRLINNKSLKGRSVCESCKKTIAWFDLIPVVSYLMLKGRCRECHKKIEIETLFVELTMGVLSALLFYQLLPSPLVVTPNTEGALFVLSLLFKLFALVVLAIVFIVDLRTGYIYDKITYPAIIMGVAYWIIASALSSWEFYYRIKALPIGAYLMPPHSDYLTNHLFYIWESALWGLLSGIGAALFFVLLIIITRGRGMGWGDVKFVVFLGLLLNFPKIVLGVFLAFFLGSAAAIALMALGRKKIGQTIPFGPFLSLGALIALLWGDQILGWYSRML